MNTSIHLPEDTTGNSENNFERLLKHENILNEVHHLLKRLGKLISLISTKQDTFKLRHNINKLEKECKQSLDAFEKECIIGNNDVEPELLVRYKKLLNTLESHLKQHSEAIAAKGSRQKTPPNDLLDAEQTEENAQLLQTTGDSQMNTQAFIEEEDAAARSRQQDILEIQKSVRQINEIFEDLGVLVQEQQDFVDCIELNIENAVSRVHASNREISQTHASTLRKRYNCCGCKFIHFLVIILVFCAFVAIVLTN